MYQWDDVVRTDDPQERTVGQVLRAGWASTLAGRGTHLITSGLTGRWDDIRADQQVDRRVFSDVLESLRASATYPELREKLQDFLIHFPTKLGGSATFFISILYQLMRSMQGSFTLRWKTLTPHQIGQLEDGTLTASTGLRARNGMAWMWGISQYQASIRTTKTLKASKNLTPLTSLQSLMRPPQGNWGEGSAHAHLNNIPLWTTDMMGD